MLGLFYKALSFFWLFKAASKGPRGIAAYAARRTTRRAVNRGLRNIR